MTTCEKVIRGTGDGCEELARKDAEIARLRRKIGEWADRLTQKHGMTGGMVVQMREEANK